MSMEIGGELTQEGNGPVMPADDILKGSGMANGKVERGTLSFYGILKSPNHCSGNIFVPWFQKAASGWLDKVYLPAYLGWLF
jgi:hypothetical protein